MRRRNGKCSVLEYLILEISYLPLNLIQVKAGQSNDKIYQMLQLYKSCFHPFPVEASSECFKTGRGIRDHLVQSPSLKWEN